MTQPATVFILDFGAQYSQLHRRRTREMNVYCEIVPFDTQWSTLAPRAPRRSPERRTGEHAGSRSAADGPGDHPQRRTDSGHLLWHAARRRECGAESVKLDHAEYGPATLSVDGSGTPLFKDVRHFAGVDVARRLRRAPARRVRRSRVDRAMQRGCHGKRRAQDVRRCNSTRKSCTPNTVSRSSTTFCTRSPA